MIDHPYICLDTDEDLDDEQVMCWMACVQEHGPPGIVASIETKPNGGQLSFYRRKNQDGSNHYVSVLARDLGSEEATGIAKGFSEKNPTGDFMIHWSQPETEPKADGGVKEDILRAIALEAAKKNHNRWLSNRVDEGWRFGIKHDPRAKTSPTCRDWDSLPESYRRAEYRRMMALLEILESMNLQIRKK